MAKRADITGKRFGHLVAVEAAGRDSNGKILWRCRCDCGREVIIPYGNLAYGNSKSCGCKKPDACATAGRANKKHGQAQPDSEYYRLYSVWDSMKMRCYNPNAANYKNYGGRGITICDEWKNNFPEFMKWALNNGYDVNAKVGECTIDRIDCNGNYTPDNCRFVDMKTQQNNRRNNRYQRISA